VAICCVSPNISSFLFRHDPCLFFARCPVLRYTYALTDPSPRRCLMGVTTETAQEPTAVTASRLYECPDCGQIQIMPPLPPGARAVCLRCDAVLRHTRRDPLLLPLALNISALILFLLGATLTLMSVSSAGQHRSADLTTGPIEMEQYGLWEV
jgi:hypothetical protein